MKLYEGARRLGVAVVTVRDQAGRAAPLAPRLDLLDHSTSGLEWGCGGGAAQLALALLADALGDDERAVRLHEAFRWALVAAIPQAEPWAISDTVVRVVAAGLEDRQREGEP
jgi:hypothetical protein